MAKPKKVEPKWLIDLHGMRDVLLSKKNSTRSAIISAIESGEMLILKSVSESIKSLYPAIYASFQSINPKKYHEVTLANQAASAVLMEITVVVYLDRVQL